MIYNIHYDISAIVIYALILYCIFSKKDLRKMQNKMFLVIILTSLATTIFDIISAYTNSYSEKYSMLILYLMNFIYLFLHNAIPILFCIYVAMVSGIIYKNSKRFLALISIPFVISIINFIINPFFDCVFYINDKLEYIHGPLMTWIHISAFFYIVVSIVFMVKNISAISTNKVTGVIFFSIGAIISLFIQLAYPKLLIELFVQSLALFGILITIENEDEVSSGIKNVYNKQAFLNENAILLGNKIDYNVITIKFTNYKYYSAILGAIVMNDVRTDIAHWLCSINKKVETYDCENGAFSIIMKRTSKEEAFAIAENIKEKFSKDWIYNDINVAFNTQICFINIPDDVSEMDKFLSMFDAEYSKNDNKVSFIYGEQLKFLQRELEVEKAIQRALDNKSFRVFYQPIWDKKTEKIHSAEALVRLFDEKLGNIPPDEFIPIAERNGKIIQIGEYVFEEVCRMFSDNNIQSYGIEFIEVNLSMVQCMHRNLAEKFDEILKKYNISSSYINLEITESAAANSPEMFLNTMEQLKELGFTFSMDDYGTGYSNFSYMFDLDFDIIKLDKSILWNSDKNERAKIILNNTVKMLKEMGLQIVMEGVETEVQKDYVIGLGCDYLQGYYFSRPVERVKFIEYCEQYNG